MRFTIRIGILLSVLAAVVAIALDLTVSVPAVLILIPVVIVGFALSWHATGHDDTDDAPSLTRLAAPWRADEGAHRRRARARGPACTAPSSATSSTRSSGCGFDSLWLSERISGEAPDPVVAMSYAAGRTTRLKFGMSVLVLPGRNPVVLAKELATLAVMSGGRLLPAFGLGVADGARAPGVRRRARRAGDAGSTRRWP